RAARGRTHRFMPMTDSTPASTRNSTTEEIRIMSLASSDADIDDLSDSYEAQGLQPDTTDHHDLADRIGNEEQDVIGVGVEHQDGHGHRNHRKHQAGNAPMSADGADLAA